ncbi:LysR family transcriptional regulator [Serratia sp. Lou2A]|jgi:LysR family glycine cleavage system transcriptional activator|uniref:LysR family transcriptional regulator n=1 Tax=Serratia montpellierensis TaxID=2598730 RepID=A0ABS8J6M2_9GAMM|nr:MULTISPECIES: LysR family transcriptional regulator [unclassified Serratia (in: enterobacteria)]BEM32461.1 LysR family transcriptional regulator [Serratia marcescens]MCC7583081.1 LysR family transcriptional regulator [Serratia sp. Lou2A]MCC7659653.1 LysR family transcriptional regulator [Serratia sp. Pon4B]BEM42591.1 LysR family transcriptional regulator [Serratia marcescens]BEM52435.1 LysR family transcriptional regulator [Serratia marcescens]
MNSDNIGEKNSRKTGRPLPLGGLRCFEAAARLESFTQAAQGLNLTHGAVSRAVRALEEELGVALFERRHRRVLLTAAGRKLFQATQQAFGILDHTVLELRQQALDAPLVLSCEPTLLMRWLIPRLPAFQQAHPDINLQLVAGGGPFSFHDGITAAIRRNDFDWGKQVHSLALFSEKVGPVCQPAALARMTIAEGSLRSLRPGAKLLHAATRPDAWWHWAQQQGMALVGHPEQRFDHFYFSLQAAVAGLGIAMAPWLQVRDDLAAGLLSAPFGFTPDGSGYYLLSPQAIVPGSALARLAEWLRLTADA